MKTPKISIIIPIYNVEKYLNQCIDSVINQTYKNIEIILIDDGSPDNCPQICDDYAKQDNRIVVVHKQNGGLSDARNTGLKAATGAYIMFVDADDWINLETCEKMYMDTVKHDADVVMCSYIREYPTASLPTPVFEEECFVYERDEVKYKLFRRLFGLAGDELRRPEQLDRLVPACMKLYKARLIKDIRFIDTKTIGTEDCLFNIEVFSHIKRAVYRSELLYHYRREAGASITSVHRSELYEKWQNLFSYMEQFIIDNHLEDIFIDALYNRIAVSMLGLGLNEICSQEKNIFQKAKRLKYILEADRYRSAFRKLTFKYFPIHWKIFYTLCKYKMSFLLTISLYVISMMKGKL